MKKSDGCIKDPKEWRAYYDYAYAVTIMTMNANRSMIYP